jgi:hypothetical protein
MFTRSHLPISLTAVFLVQLALATPPAVGIVGSSRDCNACHVNSGQWLESPELVIDLVDPVSKTSFRQPNGSFLLSARRGETVNAVAIFGYKSVSPALAPHRNGWIFVDTTTIGTEAISKFAPGWEISLPYGCKISGDKSEAYPDAQITSAPFIVKASESAADRDVTLQVLLTSGEAVKGKAKEGLVSDYFSRQVHLRVNDRP